MDNPGEELPPSDLVSLSVELVSAYVTNNTVTASELPKLLSDIHGVLRAMNAGIGQEPAEEKLVPAVPVKKSVSPDSIICLEDGKAFKSLKRHLQTRYGLTPRQYREKWNLPADYPMVAPNYAAARSALAKAAGLGQLRAAKASTADRGSSEIQAPEPTPTDQAAPKRRGRPAKAAASAPVVQEAKRTARTGSKAAKASANSSKPKRAARKATAN